MTDVNVGVFFIHIELAIVSVMQAADEYIIKYMDICS